MIKFALLTLFTFGSLFSQVPPAMLKELSPDMQKKLLSANSANLSNIDPLKLDAMVKKNTFTTEVPADTVDSLADKDSIPSEPSENLSTFQQIFRGDTIHPDSLLPKLTIFGLDMFSRQKSDFSPINNFSIPPEYVINPEDEIIILLWGRINEEYRLIVNRDGTINIPRIGPFSVAGLPYATMQKNILNRVEQIEGVHASISVGNLRTIGIFIVGEVVSPGFYTISSLSNATNALFAAGGLKNSASFRNIQLKRNEKTVATIDLYDFLLKGKDKSSLRLEAGDVIHVPVVSKMVAVAGNVQRSALYEIHGSEKLTDVLNLAGGFTPAAHSNHIQIARFTDNKQVVMDLDSSKTAFSSFPVQNGDIIKIFPVLFKNENAVFLDGNVLRPGIYEFTNDMRVSDIIKDYKQLLPETYFDYALIIRKNPPHYNNELITFNIKNILDNPKSNNDIALQPRDQIMIYHRDYFEPDRSVEIYGSITSPGKTKLLHNMTIRDLILQASGLTEDASATRGELYRRTVQKNDLVVTDKIDFCVACVMENDAQHNIMLNKSDRVFIRSKLGWEKESKITLKGQFKFPGVYVIFEGETLGDLIKRAGGFTKNAYLSAGVFTRTSVKEKEKSFFDEYNNQLEKEILNLSSEIASKTDPLEAKMLLDQQNLLQKDLQKDYKFGRVVINLTDDKNYKDLILENGDELNIPRNPATVSVLGEIYNPSTFKFENNGSTVSSYIDAAGGFKNNADTKHIYIIKANGSIVTNNSKRILSNSLEPGDAIVVPQKIKYSNPQKVFVETADSIFKIASLFGTILAIIIASKGL